MKISDLRDAPDAAGDLASASLRYVSDASLPQISRPDVSLPDALDIDVADLAGDAIEFAGEVAGAVVTQSGRGLAKAIRFARRNPETTIGVIAVVLVLVGLLAAKKKSSSDSTLDAVS